LSSAAAAAAVGCDDDGLTREPQRRFRRATAPANAAKTGPREIQANRRPAARANPVELTIIMNNYRENKPTIKSQWLPNEILLK